MSGDETATINGRMFFLRFVIFVILGTQLGALTTLVAISPSIIGYYEGVGELGRTVYALMLFGGFMGLIPALVAGATMPRAGSRRVVVWLAAVALLSFFICGILALGISIQFSIGVTVGGVLAAWICRYLCIRLNIDDWHKGAEVRQTIEVRE